MKNLFLFLTLLVLSGCSANMLIQVDYLQKGEDCIYVEQAGVDESNVFARTFSVDHEKVIRYPDTKCSTVVEYDLKNAKNKEHFVHKIHGIGGTDKKPIH